jgi:cell division protein FtsI (penicillin-binding protein 3)
VKPFIAAGLLERGRVADHDSVDTGDGLLEINGRPIHDEHLIGRAPLSQVLRWSSNIGIVKFAERLTPKEQFETLRDFGFGTATGLPFPSESEGVLRSPKSWSKQSANSLAMGYEMSVTPLQLAAAYAAFANGGELIQPALVKEVISPDGSVRYRHSPRVVRRVMSKPVAEKVRRMLLDVVDEGTALEAAIDTYQLAGKTGSPRAAVRGRYTGQYNPNFVGLFPGDNPQYVIVVKMAAPQNSIFAAKTAAPVTKLILQAAIAARDAALDRSRLASSVIAPASSKAESVVAQAAVQQTGTMREPGSRAIEDSSNRDVSAPFVVTLPLRTERPPPRVARAIPDVRGLVLRDAVRSLHSAGFRVQLARPSGTVGNALAATAPAAGELVPTGTLVRLLFDY